MTSAEVKERPILFSGGANAPKQINDGDCREILRDLVADLIATDAGKMVEKRRPSIPTVV